MPFTPTHILPMIPLRRWLPFSALAIGAMVPDIPMFFPICLYSDTHSPTGAVTVCAPIGFAIFLLFELVMRRPLVELLPLEVARRINSRPNFQPGFSFLIRAAVALIIGAYSHQVWDAFSHKGRWGTRLLPILDSHVSVGSLEIPGYKIVQYGSTLVGLTLIAVLLVFWFRRTLPDSTRSPVLNKWTRSLAYCLLVLIPIAVGLWALRSFDSYHMILSATITRSGTIIGTGLAIYSVLFHWRLNRRQ